MKYDEIVRQFKHNIFGTLTTIRSIHDPDKFWFVGKEIQNALGLKNLSKTIKDAGLDNDEIFEFTKDMKPEFWKNLIDSYQKKDDNLKLSSSGKPLISKFTHSITLISETGLYGLTFNSRKPQAKKFKKWIARDVLPVIRNLAKEDAKPNPDFELTTDMKIHTANKAQVEYSKLSNHVNYKKYGKDGTIKFNRKICFDHCGKTPKQLVTFSKKNGDPSKVYESGQTVLRKHEPESASSISLHKDMMFDRNVPYDEAVDFSVNTMKPIYKEYFRIINAHKKN